MVNPRVKLDPSLDDFLARLPPSLTFNLAGIFGASLAPYIATGLAKSYGLQYVGYYLSLAAALTLIGLLMAPETKDQHL